jgi:hypothetical protein
LKLNLNKMTDTKKALLAAGAVLLVAFVVALVQDNGREVELNTSGAVSGNSEKNPVLNGTLSLPDRAKASDIVVLATVNSATSSYETNAFGDRLIVTKLGLSIQESMKGPQAQDMEVQLLGGTVGEVSMVASHEPAIPVNGTQAVLFLKDKGGKLVPSASEDSIMKVSNGKVTDEKSSLTVEQVRAAIITAQ